jgi:hypothetical protein
MTDAEIDRLFPHQVILPPACYAGTMFRTVQAFCIVVPFRETKHVVPFIIPQHDVAPICKR